MLGTGNFPHFSGKNPVPRKWHLGTQTSILQVKYNNTLIFFSPCWIIDGVDNLIDLKQDPQVSCRLWTFLSFLVTIPLSKQVFVTPPLFPPFFSRGEHALRHPFLHSSLLEVCSRKKKRRRAVSNSRPLEWQASMLTARPCHSPGLDSENTK